MSDCLIIGGGVIGLSIAYELAVGGLRVEVVERGRPGREASWAGAGILPPAEQRTAADPLEQLRGMSHRLHAQWAARLRDETGIDTGYRPCGGLYLARTNGEAFALHALANLLQEQGIDVQQLTPRQLVKWEKGLRDLAESGRLKAAYRLPGEAQLRNPDHLQALAAACMRRGVRIHAGEEVAELAVEGGRLRRIRTPEGWRAADRFCLAAGAWSYRLLDLLNVRCGILPVRGQMVLFRCPQPPFRHVLNEGPRYLVPRDDGHVLVGSTEEEVGFDKSTTEEAIAELTELARSLVPSLRKAPVERTWAGLRPGSFDGFPYLGKVPGLDNVFVAAGHFRSGLHLSPATATVMSRLIRGLDAGLDLSPFRVGRG